MHTHFGNKNALNHVLEKKAEGFKEIHSIEQPDHMAAGADAFRETAVFLLIFSVLVPKISLLWIASVGWLFWKIGRAAVLGWSRLEHLHRLIEQEKYEIEHHRYQEKEELMALYRSKGLEGQLLEDVINVFMADQDRLLKIMLEEEMGLTLEAYEHPLKQALGAAFGVILASMFCLLASFLFPNYGMIVASFLVVGLGALITALYEGNRIISAIIWYESLTAVTFGLVTFLTMMM